MTAGKGVTTKVLYWSDLKPLCASGGPCITITLPAFHHGAQALPHSTNLKAAVRQAQQLLLKQSLSEEGEGLLAPIRELAEDPEMNASGRARMIFRSPGGFRQFYLPGLVPLRTVVGPYCHILPFLNQLCADREFYILGLNEKHLHLLHYTDGNCEEVQLPDGVPKNAEAAGAFDPPDHTLRDQSGAGQSSGIQSAVVFGTGSEREKAHERLREFFRLVDQGLSKVLAGQPLLLSGVGYEVAIYRRAAIYPFLMEGYLEGDLHDLRIQEIAHRASEQARIQARKQAEKQLHLLREMAGTKRTSFDIHLVLKAAEEGRVAKLILGIEEEAEFGTTLQGVESDSQEGLLNAAAVLSIRNGAEVFMLSADAMGPLAPLAAMFRY
jgi:hypothetical protein